MSTAQNWLITATVTDLAGNLIPLGQFDTKSGGDPTSEPPTHRPGGMGELKSYAVMPSFGDLTIGRDFSRERDVELYRRLLPLFGRGRASITVQPLDASGAPFGQPYPFTGRLKSGTDPEVDSDSEAFNTFQLVFTITARA